jgi:hypothetical protein
LPDNSSREIAIPLSDSKQLGEFIAGLLGQRRSIERHFDRRFDIDFDWLLNLNEVIAQRLAAQNDGVLVSFSARIYFGNGKIVTLEDQQAFRTFRDFSNELSVGVDLRWSYLIQFPLAPSPEKQELRFLAFTKKDIVQKKPEPESKKSFIADAENERLAYSIHFTDVTWGEDLSAHIGNYITSKTAPLSKWNMTLNKMRSTATLPLALAAVFILMSVVFLFSSLDSELGLEKYQPLARASEKLKTTEEKLDFIVAYQLANVAQKSSIFIIRPFFRSALLVVAAMMIFFVITIRKASFIKLNESSERYYNIYNKNYEYIKYSLIIGSLISIASGMFANRLYDAVKTLW